MCPTSHRLVCGQPWCTICIYPASVLVVSSRSWCVVCVMMENHRVHFTTGENREVMFSLLWKTAFCCASSVLLNALDVFSDVDPVLTYCTVWALLCIRANYKFVKLKYQLCWTFFVQPVSVQLCSQRLERSRIPSLHALKAHFILCKVIIHG